MKILSIVGARPQFIKEAMLQFEINKHKDINEIVVHTGQHYDTNMSDIFFEVLQMKKPQYNLGIQASSHANMTGKMIIALEEIMIKENPDYVLLHGDTNSTLAGAIVASKLKIKIAHVESGLRQTPKDIPEEINRVLIDRVSDFLFAPTKIGVENLKKEGRVDQVFFTGDVMYDIYLKMKPKFDYEIYKSLGLRKENYIVMTLHRDFNVDSEEVLKDILIETNKISKEIPVVLPLHPRTKKKISEFGFEDKIKDVIIIEPLDYLELMGLTENSWKIITDSGGYQKEAYFAKKKACVLMEDTGWKELILNGNNVLVNSSNLFVNVMKNKDIDYIDGIYGNGNAASKIVDILKRDFYCKETDDEC